MSVSIIAHRGWWRTKEEQNTLVAFERAFDAGFGVELDVRDANGSLIVSHDPPIPPCEVLGFTYVLTILGDRPNTLAVNVKSCGLAPWFAKLKAPKDWFFFDVAEADEKEYRYHSLPLCFVDTWRSKIPLFTSPELCGGSTSYTDYWLQLKILHGFKQLVLITDYPDKAKEFFK